MLPTSGEQLYERLNQTLVQSSSKIVYKLRTPLNWDQKLNQALLVIRTQSDDVTGWTPSTWPTPRQDYLEGYIKIELI